MRLSQQCVVWSLTALAVASPIEHPAEEPVENDFEKRVWMSYGPIDPMLHMKRRNC
jgi:hypothetical protein